MGKNKVKIIRFKGIQIFHFQKWSKSNKIVLILIDFLIYKNYKIYY